MEKQNNAYLDIYKDKEIVIKQSYNFCNEEEKNNFFDYLNFLKKQNIAFSLIDENNKLVYKYEIDEKNNKKYIFNKQVDYTNKKIQNILLLENYCELKDIAGNKVEFLSKDKLYKILKQEHPKFKIANNSKLYKKLNEIYKLLDAGVDKITLTNSGGLKEELEGFGSGTMFVNLKKSKFKNLYNFNLFKQIYDYQLKNENWKKRTEEELKNLAKNYKVLELDGTILGGYALNDYEIEIDGNKQKGKLLENIFAVKEGGGIGYILGEEIKKQDNIIFAYSKQEEYFKNLGFKKIEGYKSNTGADLWKYEKKLKN